MDFVLIMKAALALSVIGTITAALLSVAASRFRVQVDPRVEGVLAVLPGSNCGACGNPSCFAAAENLATGDMPVTLCTAGGQPVADQVAEILGVEKCEVLPEVSQRGCGGGTRAARSFEYSGLISCRAVSRLAGGDLVCQWGCFGYGDCVGACPFDAIALDARNLPFIDLDLCTGCGLCVAECPRSSTGLLTMVPESAPIAVRCSAHDKVRSRKESCAVCCIACKRCEKACPQDAIVVTDLLAVVDWGSCTGCGSCVSACPQKCIDVTGRFADVSLRQADGAGPDAPGFRGRADADAGGT